MSHERTLTWLAALQADITAVLRSPLQVRDGVRRPAPERYPSRACAAVSASAQLTAAERLAVYNRQYWLRLMSALQDGLPLTCRLVGAWHFNSIAMRFLSAHPPRVRDLGALADGFDHYLEHALCADVSVALAGVQRVVPRLALIEAARLDLAFRRSFAAPPQASFLPDAARRPGARIEISHALTLFHEHWPLVALRQGALAADVETPFALPERHADLQTWAIFRTARGTGTLALTPGHARLLELLRAHSLAGALEQLEAEWPTAERATLPAKVQRWLSTSVRLGFFATSDASKGRIVAPP